MYKSDIKKTTDRKQDVKQKKPNHTGLPDHLKAGIEYLSGISMDDVRVHYNSDKPARIQALAYTQGTDIHVASGQDGHLAHEAWHVVQQKQGRVAPTMQYDGNFINNDQTLEHEADVMGAKAVQGKFKDYPLRYKNITNACMQRAVPWTNDLDNYMVNVTTLRYIPDKSTITMKTPLQAEDKVKALQGISQEAARIGGLARGHLPNDEYFNAEISAEYKTRRHIGLSKSIDELDENYDAEPYMKDAYREELEQKRSTIKPVSLHLKYQFRDNGANYRGGEVGGPGYIISVGKSTQAGADVLGDMVNGHVDTTNTYSNQHEVTAGKILGETYKRDNGVGRNQIRSRNFDAYTKLAGEGARFQCVRRNIGRITNNTVIYAAGEKEGVRFSELWLTWSASFDKEYDISDRTVAQKLLLAGGGKAKNTLLISSRRGDRYTAAVPVPAGDDADKIEVRR